MSKTQTTIVYTDPRYIDGDPYEVAERAVQQVEAVVKLLSDALDDAEIMARNAELSRQEEPDAKLWPESAEARQYGAIREAVGAIQRKLGILKTAAAFNPKARI